MARVESYAYTLGANILVGAREGTRIHVGQVGKLDALDRAHRGLLVEDLLGPCGGHLNADKKKG